MEEGSVIPTLERESTLTFTQLQDEEEEDEIRFLMMGAIEPTIVQDLSVTMEDIFGDLLPEGQQTTSLEATKWEEVKPETAIAEEAIADRVQEGEAQDEDSLPEEHPSTPMVAAPSFVPDISPTQRTSSLSRLRQFAIW